MLIRLSAKLVKYETEGGSTYIYHYCVPCKHCHQYQVPRWTFNGNIEAPSFSPSMREFYRAKDGGEKTLCHYFLTDGIMKYCGDSPHDMAGKEMPLADIPEDYGFGNIAMKDLPH
jgi:hypothetical protein